MRRVTGVAIVNIATRMQYNDNRSGLYFLLVLHFFTLPLHAFGCHIQQNEWEVRFVDQTLYVGSCPLTFFIPGSTVSAPHTDGMRYVLTTRVYAVGRSNSLHRSPTSRRINPWSSSPRRFVWLLLESAIYCMFPPHD